MKILSARRAVAGLSLAALAGVGLVSVPTPAHAQVDPAWTAGDIDIDHDDACEGSGDFNDWFEEQWSDNGAPHGGTASGNATIAAGEGDVVDTTAAYASTITSTPLGGGPATITGKVTTSASALAREASTDCDVRVDTDGQAYGIFTLTQPMWVTLTLTGDSQRQGDAGASMTTLVGNAYLIGGGPLPIRLAEEAQSDGLSTAIGNKGTASASTLFPAGQYAVLTISQAFAGASGDSEGSIAYTGNFKIDFQTPGSASAATGKGVSKVQFGARDCATGNVPVDLSKKTVKKAKRVAVRINGAKGPVLKGKGLKGKKPKAKSIVVPTSATGIVKVKVKIVQENGRRMQATRSYLPCK